MTPWKHKKSVVFWCFQGYKKLTSTETGLFLSQTATFYNPSILKTIDWENKLIYITFGILNVVFSTQNRYFPFFNSTFKLQAGKGRGGRGGGGRAGERGGGDVSVYFWEGLDLYTILLGWL